MYDANWKWDDKVLFLIKQEAKPLTATDIETMVSIQEPERRIGFNVVSSLATLKKNGLIIKIGSKPALYEMANQPKATNGTLPLNEFQNFPHVGARF